MRVLDCSRKRNPQGHRTRELHRPWSRGIGGVCQQWSHRKESGECIDSRALRFGMEQAIRVGCGRYKCDFFGQCPCGGVVRDRNAKFGEAIVRIRAEELNRVWRWVYLFLRPFGRGLEVELPANFEQHQMVTLQANAQMQRPEEVGIRLPDLSLALRLYLKKHGAVNCVVLVADLFGDIDLVTLKGVAVNRNLRLDVGGTNAGIH